MHKRPASFLLALSLVATASLAQDEEPVPPPPPIPPAGTPPAVEDDEGVPIPPKVQNEQIEPEVRIRRDERDNVIEEYSQGGRVYMVRVVPKVGLPYYYLDEDGDGRLELLESQTAGNPVRPAFWKVKEWD